MDRKDFENKVRECGVSYGMDIYSDRELLSLATGIAPDKFTGTLQETFDNPQKIDGIGKRKELAVFAVKELSKHHPWARECRCLCNGAFGIGEEGTFLRHAAQYQKSCHWLACHIYRQPDGFRRPSA